MYSRLRDDEMYGIQIICDENIYHPGDTVTGKVFFDLKRKLLCDVVELRLLGLARVYWTVSQPTATALRHTTPHEQKLTLMDSTIVLWKDGNAPQKTVTPANTVKPRPTTIDDITRMASSTYIKTNNHMSPEQRPGIEQGRGEMAFSFDLPKEGLATSFDTANSVGSVSYALQLTCKNSGSAVLVRKSLVAVVVPANLNEIPEARRPILTEQIFQLGSSESVKVRVEAEKSGFCPGEPLNVLISVDNKSSKSIKYVTTNILQQHDCFADQMRFAAKSGTYETPGLPMQVHKIQKGCSVTFSTAGKLHVPSLIPQFAIPSLIIVEYRLQVVVGFERESRKHAFGAVQIPIFIGTVPLAVDPSRSHSCSSTNASPPSLASFTSASTEDGLRNRFAPNLVLPSAPPPFDSIVNGYEEIPNDVPPSYYSYVQPLLPNSSTKSQ